MSPLQNHIHVTRGDLSPWHVPGSAVAGKARDWFVYRLVAATCHKCACHTRGRNVRDVSHEFSLGIYTKTFEFSQTPSSVCLRLCINTASVRVCPAVSPVPLLLKFQTVVSLLEACLGYVVSQGQNFIVFEHFQSQRICSRLCKLACRVYIAWCKHGWEPIRACVI